jgi:uncharacterized protein (TIGR00369 family)
MHALARYWIDEVLGKSPFAAMLGIEIAEAEPDRVFVRLPFRPDLATVGTLIHGGAIATLIDIAGAAASGSGITENDVTGGATSQIDVAYLVTADACDLLAEARVIQRSKSQTVSDVFVRDAEGRLIAKGMVTSRIFRRRDG